MAEGKGGSLDSAASFMGNLLIPQTMAGFREANKEQQTKDVTASLFPTGPAQSNGITWDTTARAEPGSAFSTNSGLSPQMQGVMQNPFVQKMLALPAFKEKMAGAVLGDVLPQPPIIKDVAPGASIGSINPRTGEYKNLFTAPDKENDFKIGATREVQIGDQKHTQEYQGKNIWKDIGTGPAFSPQQEPAPVEVDDPTSPTGRRIVSRAQGLNQPGPAQQSPQASANTLRDEFNKQTEAPRTVASMYRNGIKAAASASPAGDMGLIYSFMKALDPGSSVKEGEYAQGENLTGAYGKFWQSYNKAKDGEKLLPEVRADILGQLKNIYASHMPAYAATKQRYSDIATRQRVKPEDVVSDLPPIEESKTGAPTPSQADLEFTARKHGLTVEEVMKRLRESGGD